MIETKLIAIDGIEFQLRSIPILSALKLDKKVVSLLLPLLGGVEDISLDAKIDIGKGVNAIAEVLGKMPDVEFEKFVIDMLSSTVAMVPGEGAQDISAGNFNTIFAGRLMTVYKLLWEVMKFNKFSPFVLAEGGLGIAQIFTSVKENQEILLSGEKSEVSEN
jgi:hypothetical protein